MTCELRTPFVFVAFQVRIVVFCFIQVQDGMSMVNTGTTTEGDLRYFVCKAGWWDYSTEVGKYMLKPRMYSYLFYSDDILATL